ncbi:uncharacterized protein LOC111642818 [Copidosoma floridanum]|uniref:uncharacterized protein LOC111642818 n=1 Tax=Copidosoma floridanum TaxID=29053 RepID=UPI000C6F91C6|nr:uncharacterized protein LOC111642818 [Copidosoma floridanum]
MKSADVTADNQAQVLQKFTINDKTTKRAKFKVNNKVYVNKAKNAFEKGYTPTEIFTVYKALKTHSVTYYLKDYKDQLISDGFYEQELLKSKYPDIFLVEKVMKKRINMLYVKWLGFDKSHNSWIDKSDV